MMRSEWLALLLLAMVVVYIVLLVVAAEASKTNNYEIRIHGLARQVDTNGVEPPSPTPTASVSTITPVPPTSTPVASPRASCAGFQCTESEMRGLLWAAGFPEWAHPAALSVAWCESRWIPSATGAQGERGLFQVHPRWHHDATWDPLGNAKAAHRISAGGANWNAWSCQP